MILTFKSFIASTHVQKHVRQREKHCTVHTIQLLHDLEGCSKFVLYKVGGFIIALFPSLLVFGVCMHIPYSGNFWGRTFSDQ